MINETYEWLYDHYALPLLRIDKESNQLRDSIISHIQQKEDLSAADRFADLCRLWGEESFSLGLQLGLRLMAGQCADLPML